jgi:putative ABC transport system permease protein
MPAGREPSRADRLFRALLRAFPFEFRADYGREMEQTFRLQRRDAQDGGGTMELVRLWWETIRDVFTTAPREHVAMLRQDVGYALRVLGGAPVFTAAAVFSVAIGATGVVSVFSILNAFLFRPLSVDRPDELVSISTLDAHVAFPHGLSFPDLQDYRTRDTGLTYLLAYIPRPAALDAGRGAERVTVELVTDNYFSVLGIRPALGRLIQPNEGRARGDAPVLVLTHDY